MQVQLNLGLRIPTVKLEVDFNDRCRRVTLQQQDLTFSPDGKTVSLRYTTLERLCRQAARLEFQVKVSIRYVNEAGQLKQFPKELKIISPAKPQSQQPSQLLAQTEEKHPLINVGPLVNVGPLLKNKVQEQAIAGLIPSPRHAQQPAPSPKNGSAGAANERIIKIMLELMDGDQPVAAGRDRTDSDEQFSFSIASSYRRGSGQRPTLVDQQEFIRHEEAKQLVDRSEDAFSGSFDGLDGVLADLQCDEFEAQEERKAIDDVDKDKSGSDIQSESSDQEEADDVLEGLSDCLAGLDDEESDANPKQEAEPAFQKADEPTFFAQLSANQPEMKAPAFDRRPSAILRRAGQGPSELPFQRVQSQNPDSLFRTRSLHFGEAPTLSRAQSLQTVSEEGKSTFLRRNLKHTPSVLGQMTQEERVQELEQNQDFLLSIIFDMCKQSGYFPPQLISPQESTPQRHGGRSNNTIPERESEVSSSDYNNSNPMMKKYKSVMMPENQSFSGGRQTIVSNQHLSCPNVSNLRHSFMESARSSQGINYSVGRRDSNFFYDRQSNNPMTATQPPFLGQPSMVTTNQSQMPDRPDIIFAYANSFGTKNDKDEFIPLSERQIIKPDVMFDAIVKAVKQMKKKLNIEKKVLNFQSFDNILCKNPRVLIIMCHGKLVTDSRGQEHCFFCFENEQFPFLIDEYDEDRLLTLLQNKQLNIDVIILSTCHSERLGKILVKGIKPAPAVIAINTTDQIAQSSTFKFNQKFLQSLIYQLPVKQAFEQAKDLVATMPKEDNRCCCCNHGHTPNCLFADFVKKHCGGDWDKACQIFHQDTCDCYRKIIKVQAERGGTQGTEDDVDSLQESQLYISHEMGCHEYDLFFHRLTRGRHNINKQLENENEKGYLQQPLNMYIKGKYNLKCCCQSHVPHRESDKFMIANEEGHDQKLSKANIFGNIEDGELEIIQKSYDNIKGLKDNWPQIFPRKEEVQEILCFLKDSHKILIVIGPKSTGRIYTIGRAVRYAAEHDFEAVQDGAYYVDLGECKSIQDVYLQLIEALELHIQPDLNQILNDTYLKQKKSVIVFQNMPYQDEIFSSKFIKFIKRLRYNSELRMIMILDQNEAQKHQVLSQEQFPTVTMHTMDKPQAIEFLKRLLYLERKTEFIRGIDLENHKIIQMWERLNFVDKEAFRIANQLSKRRKLIDIANDIENRLSMEAIDPDHAQVGIDTALSSYTVLTQMVRAGEKLLNDLIIFLTVCPSGLGLTEIEILLRMLPSELKPEAKAKQITFYLDMFRECSRKQEGDCRLEGSADLNPEQTERQENLKDVINSLLFFEFVEEPFSETIVKLSEHEQKALEFIVRSNSQISQQIANISSQELLKVALDFFLTYARYLLFKVRDVKINDFTDHRFISASLMMGMWSSMRIGPEFDDFKAIDKSFGERFQLIKNNIFNLLKQEKVELLVPNLLLSSVSDDHSPEYNALNVTLVNDLREISIVTVGILARLEQPQVAIVFVDQARQLFNFEENTWTHGVLDLLHASSIVRLARLDGNFEDMGFFHDKMLSSFKTFYTINDSEGMADVYFSWAIMMTLDPNYGKHGYEQVPTAGFDASQVRDGPSNSLSNDVELQRILTGAQGGNGDSPRSQMLENPTILQCLDEALRLYRKTEESGKKVSFNIAKCLYEKALWIISSSYGNDAGFVPSSRRMYFQGRKNEILDCIAEVKKRVKEYQSMHRNRFQVNQVYIQNFYARCNLVKAKLFAALEDESEALQFIQNAQENLENLNKYQMRKMASELQRNNSVASAMTLKEHEENAQDSQIMQTLTNLKNLILHKMRLNANNLLTFAKATPLVHLKRGRETEPVEDSTRSDFNMRKIMCDILNSREKQFKVKFDILTNRFLADIARDGTRLLHITSDLYERDKMWVEGAHGIANEMSLKKLEHQFKQLAPYGLQVDVVGIALPQSVNIGKVFKSQRVKHVLCFDEKSRDITPGQFEQDDLDSLVRFQFNYIYNFCVQFYRGIAQEMTVIDSFKQAEQWLEDEANQANHLWQSKKLPFTLEDLNIRAILLEPQSPIHTEKIFDSQSQENEAVQLKPGKVLDTSRMRGQLKGMTRYDYSYVGRKVEQHEVIRALSDRKSPIPLVHIRGTDHVGKTRFVQEVCYHFYRHNKFRHIIMLRDLSKIETHKEFRELMDLLNRQIETKPDCQINSYDDATSIDEVENGGTGSLYPVPEILFAFTNADKMKRDFWSRLESRLLDIYQNKPSVRYILTSSADSRKFFFSHFSKTDDEQTPKDGALIANFRRASTLQMLPNQSRNPELRKVRMDLKLVPLSEDESIELILYHTDREVTNRDFGMDGQLQRTVKHQMKLEGVITNCKGLPYFLREIAKLLNEGALLYKIRVEKQSDYLKGTQAHHKAKRKEMVVYVQKDKPLLAKNTLKLSTVSEEDNSNTASGSKPKDRHKNKSKEKTTGTGKPQLAGRTGKNQRKRENRPQLVINDYHNEQDLYSEEDTSVLDGMSQVDIQQGSFHQGGGTEADLLEINSEEVISPLLRSHIQIPEELPLQKQNSEMPKLSRMQDESTTPPMHHTVTPDTVMMSGHSILKPMSSQGSKVVINAGPISSNSTKTAKVVIDIKLCENVSQERMSAATEQTLDDFLLNQDDSDKRTLDDILPDSDSQQSHDSQEESKVAHISSPDKNGDYSGSEDESDIQRSASHQPQMISSLLDSLEQPKTMKVSSQADYFRSNTGGAEERKGESVLKVPGQQSSKRNVSKQSSHGSATSAKSNKGKSNKKKKESKAVRFAPKTKNKYFRSGQNGLTQVEEKSSESDEGAGSQGPPSQPHKPKNQIPRKMHKKPGKKQETWEEKADRKEKIKEQAVEVFDSVNTQGRGGFEEIEAYEFSTRMQQLVQPNEPLDENLFTEAFYSIELDEEGLASRHDVLKILVDTLWLNF